MGRGGRRVARRRPRSPFHPYARRRAPHGESRHDEGTHTIFVGRVVRAETDEGAPLVYGDGAFHGLTPV
ncbi:flavin reductase [Methylopila henanensis]|uniref:Flavin reductase n=1 Tax=Methylopila henanensis TaxID=873516 RepID=A0ABW4K7I4_9HYPH